MEKKTYPTVTYIKRVAWGFRIVAVAWMALETFAGVERALHHPEDMNPSLFPAIVENAHIITFGIDWDVCVMLLAASFPLKAWAKALEDRYRRWG